MLKKPFSHNDELVRFYRFFSLRSLLRIPLKLHQKYWGPDIYDVVYQRLALLPVYQQPVSQALGFPPVICLDAGVIQDENGTLLRFHDAAGRELCVAFAPLHEQADFSMLAAQRVVSLQIPQPRDLEPQEPAASVGAQLGLFLRGYDAKAEQYLLKNGIPYTDRGNGHYYLVRQTPDNLLSFTREDTSFLLDLADQTLIVGDRHMRPAGFALGQDDPYAL
jgi:hypothetical protein